MASGTPMGGMDMGGMDMGDGMDMGGAAGHPCKISVRSLQMWRDLY